MRQKEPRPFLYFCVVKPGAVSRWQSRTGRTTTGTRVGVSRIMALYKAGTGAVEQTLKAQEGKKIGDRVKRS